VNCGLVVVGSCACTGVMVEVVEMIAAESGGMREEICRGCGNHR